jgi:two-component system sensor histidine kinase SenX3
VVNFWWLFLAFVLGSSAAGLLILGLRKEESAKFDEAAVKSDSAAELLEVLAEAGIVLSPQSRVVRATTSAMAMGLIQDRSIVHGELLELVNKARDSKIVEIEELELNAGIKGLKKLFVRARAVELGSGSVLLIVDDKTESQRLDETRRDFMANISHELKTPVGAIGLLSEAILDNAGDPELVQKFSENVLKESKRLSALIKDIIQLSRIQAAETIVGAELIDLDSVVRDAIDRNAFRADRRKVKIDYLGQRGIKVIGDEEMLAVAFKNIIENAIVYSSEGSKVGVSLGQNGYVAEVKVVDNGVGIAKEDQKRIFERFYRTDPARSRETGGTGLGLSIVKHVITTHLGEIKLSSKLGVGSTFTLRLPLADRKLVVKKRIANG